MNKRKSILVLSIIILAGIFLFPWILAAGVIFYLYYTIRKNFIAVRKTPEVKVEKSDKKRQENKSVIDVEYEDI